MWSTWIAWLPEIFQKQKLEKFEGDNRRECRELRNMSMGLTILRV